MDVIVPPIPDDYDDYRATLRALAHRASGEHLYCDPYDQAETRLPD